MTQDSDNKTERSPIVVIMGHIDHGKSTLLSYIRKSTKPLNEAGDITQHISAYEVEHISKDGKKHLITFLDTPGHEAFGGIRRRGASVADIAILVISAEDDVKPQTLEALNSIKEGKTPFIVAINKIDKPGVNIERTKQSLLTNEIYIEGYGGDVPAVPISAKTGEGIPELLDMILLVAELEDLKGNSNIPAEGIVIESNLDIRKGISATCIIKNGMMEKGMYVTSGIATAPVRIMENYMGSPIQQASFSSPVKIIGWDILPEVGNIFKSFKTREEARAQIEKEEAFRSTQKDEDRKNEEKVEVLGEESGIPEVTKNSLPIIIKADTGSSLEAMISEIKKLGTERMEAKIISSGIGTIGESDVRLADGKDKAIIIGFNTKIDSTAKNLSERNEIEVKTFDIIYKMNEWLTEAILTRTPKMQVMESIGKAKILKLFSKVKDRQIVGARVERGDLVLGSQVKIIRKDVEIDQGKIKELQKQKNAINEVKAGEEFGAMIVTNVEIAPGDYIESFIITEK